jgi:hypothetical protein
MTDQGLFLRLFLVRIFSRQIDYFCRTFSPWERNSQLQLSLYHQHTHAHKQVITSKSFNLAASNAFRLGLISSGPGSSSLTPHSPIFLSFIGSGWTSAICGLGSSIMPMSSRMGLVRYYRVSSRIYIWLTLNVMRWKGMETSMG